MTLATLKTEAQRLLLENGIEETGLEVSVLAQKALGYDRTQQIIRAQDEVDDESAAVFMDLVRLRASHVPSAYITGHREFYGLDFIVTADTLIPRPDSETLVETALCFLADRKEPCVIDLCTGTGCIGISIAHSIPVKKLILTDISHCALETAKRNADALIPHQDVSLVQSDLFADVTEREADIIVTNPPYVCRKYQEGLSPEVRKEPESALFDEEEDGLGIIRKIVRQAGNHLRSGGMLAIECDYRQTAALGRIMLENQFSSVRVANDLSGRGRVVSGVTDNA